MHSEDLISVADCGHICVWPSGPVDVATTQFDDVTHTATDHVRSVERYIPLSLVHYAAIKFLF